jgi:uncharacterized cupredoxin-like copper-binding protein
MSLRTPALAAASICAFALAVAGCGGDDTTTTQGQGAPSTSVATASTATTTPAAGTLKVTMSDFAFSPKDATATAGEITLTAPNVGKAPHELVLIKSDKDPAALPTKANGEADEDAFTETDLPGEIGETEPGATGTLTVTLPAGKYVMLCNVPGHYKAGMYGTLTVQ